MSGQDWTAKHFHRFLNEGRFRYLGYGAQYLRPMDWVNLALYSFLALCVLWNTLPHPVALLNLPPKTNGSSVAMPLRPIMAPHSAKTQTVSHHPLNLNTATAQELEALPGIGPVLAQRIIQWRATLDKPIESLEELDQVSGIGPVLLSKLAQELTLDKTVPPHPQRTP